MAGGQRHRHVFGAVHGEIDAAAEERVFDLLDEQPLAAGVRERHVLQAVSRRLDHADLARASVTFEQSRHRVRLPEREGTASRSDPQRSRHSGGSRLTGAG